MGRERGHAHRHQGSLGRGQGSDRGETQANAIFLTNPVFYTSADQQARVIYTSDNEVKITNVPGGTKTTIKDWKENDRPK